MEENILEPNETPVRVKTRVHTEYTAEVPKSQLPGMQGKEKQKGEVKIRVSESPPTIDIGAREVLPADEDPLMTDLENCMGKTGRQLAIYRFKKIGIDDDPPRTDRLALTAQYTGYCGTLLIPDDIRDKTQLEDLLADHQPPGQYLVQFRQGGRIISPIFHFRLYPRTESQKPNALAITQSRPGMADDLKIEQLRADLQRQAFKELTDATRRVLDARNLAPQSAAPPPQPIPTTREGILYKLAEDDPNLKGEVVRALLRPDDAVTTEREQSVWERLGEKILSAALPVLPQLLEGVLAMASSASSGAASQPVRRRTAPTALPAQPPPTPTPPAQLPNPTHFPRAVTNPAERSETLKETPMEETQESPIEESPIETLINDLLDLADANGILLSENRWTPDAESELIGAAAEKVGEFLAGPHGEEHAEDVELIKATSPKLLILQLKREYGAESVASPRLKEFLSGLQERLR